MENLTLVGFLSTLASGVGTVPLVSAILNKYGPSWSKGTKRAVGFIVSSVLSIGAYFALVALDIQPLPETTAGLINALGSIIISIMGVSFSVSQLVLAGAKSDALKQTILGIAPKE